MHQQHVAGGEVAVRYLARRPIPVTVVALDPLGEILRQRRRRSGRRASTLTMRAPSITGCSPRRTVSTSGSSGTQAFLFTFDGDLRRSIATGATGDCDRGIDSASAPPGLWSRRTEDCHAGHRRNPFRLPDHRSRSQAGDGGRGLSQGRAPLRPDERPHVRRAASRLEGRDGDHAEPAAEGPLCRRRCRRRHRGRGLPDRRGRRPRRPPSPSATSTPTCLRSGARGRASAASTAS